MSRDKNRTDSTTNPRGKSSKPLLAQGEDSEQRDPVPADRDASIVDDGNANGKKRELSPNQRRRNRRAQRLLLATILTGVFITIVMLSRGGIRHGGQTQVPTIAPRVLFDQLCAALRDTQADTLHVTEFAVDDEMVDAMVGMDSLETVIFDQGAVTDKAMERISQLPKLQHLRLRLSPIGDEGMARIATIDSLWYVNLPHAECTAAGVAELASLPRLRQLRLGSPNLGNEVTREIAKITSLRGIHLIGIAVTDEGLKTLAAMKHLESLYLDDSAVTEAGWDWLFRERPHLHVHVNQIHHDRDPKGHEHHDVVTEDPSP